MELKKIKIREAQKNSWNNFAPGWRKWDDFTMRFLQSQRQQIIEALALEVDNNVLDIAAGTGEPGLSIASVVRNGNVTAVDLSEEMLNIANEKAKALGLNNFHTTVADATKLPFQDSAFDAVSCRLGFMFFPDMVLAAKEMIRVLKPGGKLAVTVWGEPEKNLWVTAMVGAIKRHLDMPTPLPDTPGMFRCSQPGFMKSLFKELAIRTTEETEINGEIKCQSTDEYWSFMNDVVPPVVTAFTKSPDHIRKKIKYELYDFLENKQPGRQKNVSFGARLFTARKSD